MKGVKYFLGEWFFLFSFLWHWFNEMHFGAFEKNFVFSWANSILSSLKLFPCLEPFTLSGRVQDQSQDYPITILSTLTKDHQKLFPLKSKILPEIPTRWVTLLWEKTYPARFTKNYFLQFEYLSKSERNFLTNRRMNFTRTFESTRFKPWNFLDTSWELDNQHDVLPENPRLKWEPLQPR